MSKYLAIVKKVGKQWVVDGDSAYLFEKFAARHSAVVIKIAEFRTIDSSLSSKLEEKKA